MLYLILGSVISLSFFRPSPHASPSKNINGDRASYEAVTGESADEDRTVWDSFYKNKSHIYGKEAIAYLQENIDLIPKGRAFVPAMGEGRNAIYLAKKGFNVDGNDISDVAVDKALAEAKLQHVTIKANIVDLKLYSYPENYYDFILMSLFYDKELLPHLKKALKKGAYIMFYAKVELKGVRDNSPSDFAVKAGELKEAVKEYQIIKPYQEFVDHGIRVATILAKKP